MIEGSELRPLLPGDAPGLVRFYNDLSPATIRLFRPLGHRASLKRCRRIATENYISPAPRADWVNVREDTREIAGWVFLKELTTDSPELGIAVADRFQNMGLGSALLEQAILGARRLSLETIYLVVVQDNERAIRLYERFGFETYDEEFYEHDQLSYFQMVARL